MVTAHGARPRRLAPAFIGAALALTMAGASAAQPRRPRLDVPHFHYGVGLSVEGVLSAGEVCPEAAEGVPCILGSGFGLTLRAGYSPDSTWYLGGAYTLSRHDSANLLKLAILQQLRFEVRRYLPTASRTVFYVVGEVGATGYGDEWGVESGGPSLGLGVGADLEMSQRMATGVRLVYRPTAFVAWTDGAGVERARGPLDLGIAHLLAFEVLLESRIRLSRW